MSIKSGGKKLAKLSLIKNEPDVLTTNASSATLSKELIENFYITDKNKNVVKIQVKLNHKGIYLSRETDDKDKLNEQFINIDDVVGSNCGPRIKKRPRTNLTSCKQINEDDDDSDESKEQDNELRKDKSAYLYIYAYIKTLNPLRRCPIVRILQFRSFVSYNDNLKSALNWHDTLRTLKFGNQPMNQPMNQPISQKPLLVILNPKAGSGKARELFQNQVTPVLKEAELQFNLHITTNAKFAKEFMRTCSDLAHYSGILVAGGDGLFSDVLNGFLERRDYRKIRNNLPLGIIPCGLGNGLARSIAHIYNEPFKPKPLFNGAFCCVSRKTTPMDITRVEYLEQGDLTKIYSFLSVGWGFLAKLNLKNKNKRIVSGQRLTLWLAHHLINMQTLKGKISYIPLKNVNITTNANSASIIQPTNSKTLNQSSVKFSNIQEKNDTVDGNADGVSNSIHENFDDATSMLSLNFQSPIDSWHSAISRYTSYYSLAGQSTRSRRSIMSNMTSKIEEANAYLEKQLMMPSINEPIPNANDWVTEEGEYLMVQTTNTSHLNSECVLSPKAKLNDGIILLVIVRAGISRSQFVNFLLSTNTNGTYVPDKEVNDYIQMVPVRAFRIEPKTDDGIITVDGKRINGYGPIQGEIMPAEIKIMVPTTQ